MYIEQVCLALLLSLSLALSRSLYIYAFRRELDVTQDAQRRDAFRARVPLYISLSTRTRLRIYRTHTAGNERRTRRVTAGRHSGFDRGNDVVIFRSGPTAKIKNVGRIAGDRAGRYNRRCHEVFVLPDRIDSALSWCSTGTSLAELFVKVLLFLYKANSICINCIRNDTISYIGILKF